MKRTALTDQQHRNIEQFIYATPAVLMHQFFRCRYYGKHLKTIIVSVSQVTGLWNDSEIESGEAISYEERIVRYKWIAPGLCTLYPKHYYVDIFIIPIWTT